MRKKKSRRTPKRSSPRIRRSVILDAFTAADLETWDSHGDVVQALSDRVYFELERQRAARFDDLCEALWSCPATSLNVDGWARVVDWRWSLEPLSGKGSVKQIGGRFNIGVDLDRARGQEFPAVYIAEDIDTAYFEYFGGLLSSRSGPLNLSELALRRDSSFTTFVLTGHLDQVLDLRSAKSLEGFVKITKHFTIAAKTTAALRAARLQTRNVTQTAEELHQQLLAPPAHWRAEPQGLGIPSACQIIGRFVREAGFEGIWFPSQQGGKTNLALFPKNFKGSSSRVEVVGRILDGATATVLDHTHFLEDLN